MKRVRTVIGAFTKLQTWYILIERGGGKTFGDRGLSKTKCTHTIASPHRAISATTVRDGRATVHRPGRLTAGSVMSVGFRPAAAGEMRVALGDGRAGDVIDPVGREWMSGGSLGQSSILVIKTYYYVSFSIIFM
jgi:hypothetical protein